MKNSFFPAIYSLKLVKPGVALCIFLMVSLQNYAQGDLLIYPKRLAFEGTQNRVQIIYLNNKGKETTSYKLSFIENRMKENGKFEIIEKPDADQIFASPYLRFYPRTITLGPNETQVIKVQLINTSELNPGEYRSHLYFRPVSKARSLTDTAANPHGVSLELKPIYGISIVNIIRIGEPEVKIEISNLSFENFNHHIPIISMDFMREGKASSYGDIEVHHTTSKGKKTIVGAMNGFAVYTPGIIRNARMKLKTEGVNYNKGKLTVSYTSHGTKKILYAEGVLLLKAL